VKGFSRKSSAPAEPRQPWAVANPVIMRWDFDAALAEPLLQLQSVIPAFESRTRHPSAVRTVRGNHGEGNLRPKATELTRKVSDSRMAGRRRR